MLPPLHPTIRPFAGSNLGNQPGASAASSGPPKAETQGIPKQHAVLAGTGGRQIGQANANALAAKGNAGKDYGAGGVIGIGGNPHPGNAGKGWWRNQWARTVIWVAVAKPWSSSGVGWGGSVPLGQRMSRR